MPKAKYAGMYDFTLPSIMIRDLELIKEIGIKHFDNFVDHKPLANPELDPLFAKNLFSLRGNKWREMRAILSPAFTSSKMKMMFELMSNCANEFADFVTTQRDTNIVEIRDAFSRYTNDIIATTAFGISINSMKERDNEFYKMGKDVTTFGFFNSMVFMIGQVNPKLTKSLKLRIINQRVSNFFEDIITSTIATTIAQKIERPDMLQLLIQAKESGKAADLTIQDMTAQAFIFFFRGFDTVSLAMCFTAYAIATNPEVQEKLQMEIDQVLKKSNGKITYDDLKEMQYLDAVFNETLRMYSPVAELNRECTKSVELPPATPGAKPCTVKPVTQIIIPVYGIHHDPQYFPEPDKFDPERFLDGSERMTPSAYLPFGIGPRICIGNRFAIMECKLVLFHLLKKYNFRPCEKTTVPMKFSTNSVLPGPVNGFWIKIESRK
ncbi:cytochrome P450 9e2-like [Cephus cinctus]|uniref:Cytochrome P450 9e2-like n=1 Tax=Cephus cinctus TaxID=211228 RepID=A0AAJ7BHR1_CEPCN|nr:cytochrome P450 9e2-like [Cephus cinctus]